MDAIQSLLRNFPFVGSLLAIIGLDVAMGLLLAFGNRTINSSISRIGMTRKVAIMFVVGLAFIVQNYTHGIPLANLTSVAYICSEGISIVENAAKLGVPVPSQIRDVLSKLRGESAPPMTLRIESNPQTAGVNLSVSDEPESRTITL